MKTLKELKAQKASIMKDMVLETDTMEPRVGVDDNGDIQKIIDVKPNTRLSDLIVEYGDVCYEISEREELIESVVLN